MRRRPPLDVATLPRRPGVTGQAPLADWSGDARVFVPQGYEPGYDYPLVVWLPDPARRFDLLPAAPSLPPEERTSRRRAAVKAIVERLGFTPSTAQIRELLQAR